MQIQLRSERQRFYADRPKRVRVCHERRGLLHCDRSEGHDGWHRDDWILSTPTEFESKGAADV